MSKLLVAAFLALPLILQIFNNCFGQDTDVSITVRSVSPPIAEIRGRYPKSSTQKNFSLVRNSAGFADLADRVSDIRLEDNGGNVVPFKQFIAGEYVPRADFTGWSYRVDLRPQKQPAAAAHVSWLGAEDGLLFVDDLLPLRSGKDCGPVKINLQIPQGWKAFGNENGVANCSKSAVYFLTKRAREVIPDYQQLDLVISGEWKFSDKQAVDFVNEIYEAYQKLFGTVPSGKSHIYILSFPMAARSENWEADTRGNSVIILSSDMPFQTQSIQRLHEQLRHEMFHLWFPNGVNLTGNYDWFYEGSALYESLKLGVELNRIRFDDYLDTLGRAMTIDAALPAGRSLIGASNSRANGNDTILYARGMLIAFLADLKMLVRSGGKRDFSELLRSIYDRYKDPANETDGNAAVLSAIGGDDIKRNVETGAPIDWATALRPIGIEKVDQLGSSFLRVTSNPSSSQKKLLDKLGYNNWRKTSVRPK
jgi:hypothetical protein